MNKYKRITNINNDKPLFISNIQFNYLFDSVIEIESVKLKLLNQLNEILSDNKIDLSDNEIDDIKISVNDYNYILNLFNDMIDISERFNMIGSDNK